MGICGMVLWHMVPTRHRRLVLVCICPDSEDFQLLCWHEYPCFPKIGKSSLLTENDSWAFLLACFPPGTMTCYTILDGVP